MADDIREGRLRSVSYIAVLLFLVGCLGAWVEIGILADGHVRNLLHEDPLGLFAPLTLLVIGLGIGLFAAAVHKRSVAARWISYGLFIYLLLYGVLAVTVMLFAVSPLTSLWSLAYALGAVLAFVGWVAACFAATRYLVEMI